MEDQKNNNQLQIELTEEIAQGIYSNLAIITHSSSEFVVDLRLESLQSLYQY